MQGKFVNLDLQNLVIIIHQWMVSCFYFSFRRKSAPWNILFIFLSNVQFHFEQKLDFLWVLTIKCWLFAVLLLKSLEVCQILGMTKWIRRRNQNNFFVRRYKSRALWSFFLKKFGSKIPGHFPFKVTGEWTLGKSVIRFRRTLHKHSIANFAAEFPEKQGQCSGNSVSARNYKFPLQCWWKFEMKVICSASQRSPGPSHTTRLTIHTLPDS